MKKKIIKSIIPEVRLYLLGIQILLVLGTLVLSSRNVLSIVKEFSTIKDAALSSLYQVIAIMVVVVVYMLISKIRAILLGKLQKKEDEQDG